VALEAIIGQDRPDVAVEVEFLFGVRLSDDDTTSQRREKEF
jgi:hypothetical protein